MADYSFYIGTYLGGSIPKEAFPRLILRAQGQLDQYKRRFRVEGEAAQQEMAACAMADALYYFEEAVNGNLLSSCTVGSVSSSAAGAVDCGPAAQAAELYRCAKQYLAIYRGVG